MQNFKEPLHQQSNLNIRQSFYQDQQSNQQQPKIGSYRGLIKKEIQLPNEDGYQYYCSAVIMQPSFTKLSSVMLRIEDYYLMRTQQLTKEHSMLLKVTINNSNIACDIILNNQVTKPMFNLIRESPQISQNQFDMNNSCNHQTNQSDQNNNQINFNNNNQNKNLINLQKNILQTNNNLLNQPLNQQQSQFNQQQNTMFQSQSHQQNILNQQQNIQQQFSFDNNNFNNNKIGNNDRQINNSTKNDINNLEKIAQNSSSSWGIPLIQQEQQQVQQPTPQIQFNNQVQNNQQVLVDITQQPNYVANQFQSQGVLMDLSNQFNQPEFQNYMKDPVTLCNLINCLELLKTPSDKKNDHQNNQNYFDDDIREQQNYVQLRPEYNPYKKLNYPVQRAQRDRTKSIKNNTNSSYQSSFSLTNSNFDYSRITNNTTNQIKTLSNDQIIKSRTRNLSIQAVQIDMHQTLQSQRILVSIKLQFLCSGKTSDQEITEHFDGFQRVEDILVMQLNKLREQLIITDENYQSFLKYSIINFDSKSVSRGMLITQINNKLELNIELLLSSQGAHPIFDDNYIYQPARQILQSMNLIQLKQVIDLTLQKVKNLQINNEYGSILFPGLTDLTYVDFSQSVIISEGCVMVYDESLLHQILYPEENNKLNKQCIANLRIPTKILNKFRIYQNLECDHRSVKEHLKQIMLKQNLIFKDYNETLLRYTFIIPNFNLII